MIDDEIRYISNNGYRGCLYDPHYDHDKMFYQMSIRNKNGIEVLHAFNATPKTVEELKKVVDEYHRVWSSMTKGR